MRKLLNIYEAVQTINHRLTHEAMLFLECQERFETSKDLDLGYSFSSSCLIVGFGYEDEA